MKPSYFRSIKSFIEFADNDIFNHLLNDIAWLEVREARKEYFMAKDSINYTYGSGLSAKTYTSNPFTFPVKFILDVLNKDYNCNYNVCFLNRYDEAKHQLGWHADDSPEMNNDHPIAVVSFGAEREIFWKLQDYKGVIPPENKQLLHNGSLFIMPAGFQKLYFHKIPKCDKKCGTRISLTFRNYIL
jgi:alkylated DNA repair dioxygenase AlkB